MNTPSVKKYGYYAAASLVFLFSGMYCALILLAAKATLVFEGIEASRFKIYLVTSLSVLFLSASFYLLVQVIRGLRRISEQISR